MPVTMVPEGYQAVFVGSATTLDDLGAFAPLEESADEGALFLMRLDLADFPSSEALTELEQKLSEARVEMWPGRDHYVYVDLNEPVLYIAWQKGFAFLPIILGILLFVALPPLIMSAVWWLMPADLKSMITGVVNIGVMALIMFLMMQVMKPLAASTQEKPKRLEQPRTIKAEESTA